MASAASTTPPDLLALAASFLDYLNSLGLGPLPGVLAIGLGGIAVALGTVAYLWNGFAGLINPALDFLHIPKVPTIPVCFFGQNCGGAAAAQARPAAVAVAADSGDTAVEPARPSVGRSNRNGATATTSVHTLRTPATARAAAPSDHAAAQDTKAAGSTRSTAPSAGGPSVGSSKRRATASGD